MQQTIHRLITALALSAVVVTAGFEGYSEKAYQDSAGVWTVCYGETQGVTASTVKTRAECDAMLATRLIEHAEPLMSLPDTTPPVVLLGSIDMAYNIGTSGFRSSTVLKRLQEQRYIEAGDAVLLWRYIHINKDGKRLKFDCSTPDNRVCYGLWKRRLWQSNAIGNKYESLYEACVASKEILGQPASVCTGLLSD